MEEILNIKEEMKIKYKKKIEVICDELWKKIEEDNSFLKVIWIIINWFFCKKF